MTADYDQNGVWVVGCVGEHPHTQPPTRTLRRYELLLILFFGRHLGELPLGVYRMSYGLVADDVAVLEADDPLAVEAMSISWSPANSIFTPVKIRNTAKM